VELTTGIPDSRTVNKFHIHAIGENQHSKNRCGSQRDCAKPRLNAIANFGFLWAHSCRLLVHTARLNAGLTASSSDDRSLYDPSELQLINQSCRILCYQMQLLL
jgi:hypothetical protein